MILLALIFFIILYFDISLLKKQDRELFYEQFALPPLALAVIVLVFAAVGGMALYGDRAEQLPSALMALALGSYLIRRHGFHKYLAARIPAPDMPSTLLLSSDTLGVVLYWIAGMIAFSLVIGAISAASPLGDAPLGQTVIMALFSSVFMLWLIYRVTLRYERLDFRGVLALRARHLPWTRQWFWPALLGLACALIASLVIMSRPTQPSTPFNELLSSATSSWILLAFFVVAVFLAPFLEELIFRGYFFYVIERLKGKVFAVAAIGLVFGAMHYDQYWGDWAAIIAVTTVGFLLTFLRAWTGSTVPGIVAHYAFNGGMTIIPVILALLSNPVYFEYEVRFPYLSDEQKEERLLTSIREYPQDAPAYNDLAWLYAQQGRDLERALELVNKALALDPENYAYLDTQAEILYQMGEVEEAVRIEEELGRRYPQNRQLKEQLEKFRKAL